MPTVPHSVANTGVAASVPESRARRRAGLERHFTDGSARPLDQVSWERRTTAIIGADGTPVFEQKDVEVPAFWSETATNIVAHKFFHGRLETPEREDSVRQLVSRVVGSLSAWGREGGYLPDEDSQQVFEDELAHMLVNQLASFNSPVWFNLGIEPEPQCSACFINSVEDTMASILELAKTEGMLFKYGSGTGSNLSSLRSSKEPLAGGGTASGPVSFMRGFDAFAGVIKSGGKTRRAAKMVILNVDHPDIREFVACKVQEENKARALIGAGYNSAFNSPGGAYDSVQYQNANHSVRVSDQFMEAVEADDWWETRKVTTRDVADRWRAREILRQMAEAAWSCGDPGVQYDDTINTWHTCKASGRINASNPCSEYMFLDDSACNLGSLNLLQFLAEDGSFRVEAFKHAVDVMILAQEIMVGFARYPTDRIAANSREYRPLGLGYANLGALLMASGLPYDSEAGRAYAAAVTALMTGEAYLQSARIAESMGSFPAYPVNRESMLHVVAMHRESAHRLPTRLAPPDLCSEAAAVWDAAFELGTCKGFRNSQVTVLAPTGTIGFMMDCDTTGIEPDLALVKVKHLAGGGSLRLVNGSVSRALQRLGYDADACEQIVDHVESAGSVEGVPLLGAEHAAVFDCAFKATGGTRFISPRGHLRMIGAVQPFLSGAVSKTINLPEETTPDEIEELLVEGWKLGLKSLALYRDNCKSSQPLVVVSDEAEAHAGALEPVRRRLPDERTAITHKFSVAGQEGYVTVGLYEDGSPGEVFITMAKEGSTLSGVMDAFATAVSLTLQYGVSIESLVNKFSHLSFEPSGWTGNPQIPRAKSIIDYIFRWMAAKFMSPEQQAAVGVLPADGEAEPQLPLPLTLPASANAGEQTFVNQADAPTCPNCGMLMVRSGTCHKCLTCGLENGCSG